MLFHLSTFPPFHLSTPQIPKFLLCLLLLCLASFATAAEYRDGELWLEILLNSGSQLGIKAQDNSDLNIRITELASPISRELSGNLVIELLNAEKLAFWGFLNRSEPWQENSSGLLREYFAWEDTLLVIKRENLVFEDITFSALDSAKRYATETGIPTSQIQSIPLINSTVRIRTDQGRFHYFETPLLIHTERPVQIGGVKLGFQGDFILKTIGEKLILTHFLPLEQYIAGVIQNEIGSTAPLEALKAQAVAARTHAISLLLYNRHQSDGYDLCNSTHCQVYKGDHLLNANILQAVEETRNQVLIIDGGIADATYHSCCGGKTDSSANVWKGRPLSHLMGVTCIPEAENLDLSQEKQARQWIDTPVNTQGMSSWERASLNWQKSVSRQSLCKNLGLSYLNRIVINQRGNSGRIVDMSFHGNTTVRLTSEYRIRQAFGTASSSCFYIKGNYSLGNNGTIVIYPGSTINIKGKGSGHGVGMCQVGALRLARQSVSYTDILYHFYPGTQITGQWMQHE